jgi:hypothetical protein
MSRKVSLNVIPDLPALSDSSTSCWLLPRQETTPSPVIATRRINAPEENWQ